jgi:signal peptidase I
MNPVLRELGSLAVKIAVVCAVAASALTFVWGAHRNTDPDMAPAVNDGDLVLFYRLDKDYAADDLLLLDFDGERQVRRVVAVAGDTVDITEDGLEINGMVQPEPDPRARTERYTDGTALPLTLADGQVFVLGDARQDATDSRAYGPVNTDDTLGTAITVIRRRDL